MPEMFDHILDCADCYYHGVLSPQEKKRIDEHCEYCRICKVALEEAEKRYRALTALPAREAPAALVDATLAKIEQREKTHDRPLRLLRRAVAIGLAASLLILAALHLYFANLSPSPYDLRIFGQARLYAGSDASLRVQLVNHVHNRALQDVPVQIELHGGPGQPVQLASFKTDATGTFPARFRLPDWPEGDYELRVLARPGGQPHVIARKIQLRRSWRVMLSSDRPVYQPGQTIHVRALALHGLTLKPIAGQSALFTISDPKGNVIFKQKDVTSRFGISSAECALASEIIEGAYTIECRLDDTSSKLMAEVKKYVLPKFKIELATDQPYYQPGQRVRGAVQVDYFFGKPVTGGTVELLLESREEKQRLSLHTDDGGRARFEFPPLPKVLAGSEKDAGDARLKLHATVTDTAGQQQTRSLSRVVSAQPFRIEVIPEAGTLVQGVANTIYLFVSTPDGQPVQTCVAVTGIDHELTTSELGVASFDFTPADKEAKWTIGATDAQGRTARREAAFSVGQASQDFIVRSDRAVYRGGDTLRLTALGAGSEPVFVDLLKDGQTVLTEAIAMKDGQGRLDVDLPPELSGTLQLCAYRFGEHGLPVRKVRTLYVDVAADLKIETSLDRPEYRPGDTARVRFTLKNKHGKPMPGAISLAAVDEAVFSVLEQRPGLETAFFLLSESLLRPIYALHSWSPQSIGANSSRVQFEQAVFASTTQIEAPRTSAAKLDDAPNFRLSALGSRFHALAGSTFEENRHISREVRSDALHRITAAWIVFACICLLLIYVVMWKYFSRPALIAVHIVSSMLFCGGLLFQNDDQMDLILRSSNARLAVDIIGGVRLNERYWHLLPFMEQQHIYNTLTPRLREYFPETLLWRPELITDDQGRAELAIDLADSITTWRLTASAITGDGKLGAAQAAIKVFQPFFVDINLPVALTRGDEAAVPIVLYNYLDRPQQVELKLAEAGWFESQEKAEQAILLEPREVRSLSYRLRVKRVGIHDLQVTASGSGVADAIKRRIEVVPDGRRVEHVWNGTLRDAARLDLALPANAIAGSERLLVKFYPSSFSQLVEGLDAIFQMPYGCFEQTSSTTYPNVLALDYLKRTGKSVPAVEAKARQYIHLGYQRLLGFEVSGGGFDWFGRPPANRTLTAYGLMEFTDMARVHDVDPKLIERTRKWLLDQRQADGSWQPEGHMPHGLPGGMNANELARLSVTAYIAWAVFGNHAEHSSLTRAFLLRHEPQAIGDANALALVCNALLAIDPTGRDADPYLRRLDEIKQTTGRLTWWQPQGRTTFHGAGQSGSVETTALAVLAFLQAPSLLTPLPRGERGRGEGAATAKAALDWITQQRDATGAWHSTQATVLALKALLAGTERGGGDHERRISVALGNLTRQFVIPADQADVMKQVDLSRFLTERSQKLTISETSGTAAGYQVTLRYHVPDEAAKKVEPLSIRLTYDRNELEVGGTLQVTANIMNNMGEAAPMVLLDLPIPAGFAVSAEDFEKMVEEKQIAKYQMNPRSVLVYLRELPANGALTLVYGLRATMPEHISVPPARAYEYYNPAREGFSDAVRLQVTGPKAEK